MTHTGPVACMRVPICVCVCALCIHCHAHASATVWRHKGGVLVNGTLVGAPRRRRGEQHVEKGSSCVGGSTSILEPLCTPSAPLSANLALGRLKSAHGAPVVRLPLAPVHRESPRIPQRREIGWTWRSIFDTPFKEKYGSGKVWMGEMYLPAEDFERGISWEGKEGFVSCSFYGKRKKTLLYSLMSKIRQIVWKEKTFFCCKLIFLDTSIIFWKEMREILWAQFLFFDEISVVNVAFMLDSLYEIFFGKRNWENVERVSRIRKIWLYERDTQIRIHNGKNRVNVDFQLRRFSFFRKRDSFLERFDVERYIYGRLNAEEDLVAREMGCWLICWL